MYEFIKGLHNLLRWVVLLGGVAAVAVTVRGLVSRAAWTGRERGIGSAFVGSLHLQVVLGILLYFVSPLVGGGLRDFGAAMGSDELRFFVMEHLVIMVLAAVAAQTGSSLARRAESDRVRYVRAAVGYGIAMALILYGIPWWRPLVPWG